MSQNMEQESIGEEMRLQHMERVRNRIQELKNISKDPYYDRYLEHLRSDLEEGVATPAQVEQETERSYRQYQQRMGLDKKTVPEGETVEFKIGMHLFSLIGAIFILAALVIISYNFLSGFLQGICLYAVALLLILFSECFLYKKIPVFSVVLSGIGIAGLYVVNIANFIALHTINVVTAIVVTLVIAVGAMLLGKKKNSAAFRLIGPIGCYICLLFMRGYDSELNLMLSVSTVLLVNGSALLLGAKKFQKAADSIHIWLNLVFTLFFVTFAWTMDIPAIYLALFVVAAFLFTQVLCLVRCAEGNLVVFIFSSIINGCYIFFLFLIGAGGPGVKDNAVMSLFLHIAIFALVLAIATVIFLLWKKEDGRRWGQVYYVVSLLLLLGTFSKYYEWEAILSALIGFAVVKLLASRKEIRTLDCVVSVYFATLAVFHVWDWYWWIFFAALLVSVFAIRQKHIFHEIVITLGMSATWLLWIANADYGIRFRMMDLRYSICLAILLVLFLLFNHLPMLRGKKQKGYNLTAAVFMMLCYLRASSCESVMGTAVMMVLGAVAILVIFRKRYEMEMKRKYLLLVGALAYLSICGNVGSSIVCSILLMFLALFCVGVGFWQKDKVERICGLVLAGFVCLKLVAYDFRELETIYRAFVFLAVGVIALLISFFYILLDKKQADKKQEPKQEEGQA